MKKDTYWRDVGFYECRNKLTKNWYRFGIINGMNIVSQLIQVADTDYPHFSKSKKGWNLDTMHNWITGNDKKKGPPGLAGPVNITKNKLLMALNMCSKHCKKKTFNVKRVRSSLKKHSRKRNKTRKRVN